MTLTSLSDLFPIGDFQRLINCLFDQIRKKERYNFFCLTLKYINMNIKKTSVFNDWIVMLLFVVLSFSLLILSVSHWHSINLTIERIRHSVSLLRSLSLSLCFSFCHVLFFIDLHRWEFNIHICMASTSSINCFLCFLSLWSLVRFLSPSFSIFRTHINGLLNCRENCCY